MMLAAHNAAQGQKILENLAADRARVHGGAPSDEAETQIEAQASALCLADEASASDVPEECDDSDHQVNAQLEQDRK